ERVEPCGGIPVRCARDVHERTKLLLAKLAKVRSALQGAEPCPNPSRREIIGNCFGLVGKAGVGPELAAIEPLRVAGFREKLLGLSRIVRVKRRWPVELEVLWDEAAGHPREAERHRLVDGLAVNRMVDGEAHAAVGPERLWVPLLSEEQPLVPIEVHRFEREPRRTPQVLGDRAPESIGDVSLPALEHREPRYLGGHRLEREPFDTRDLPPVLLVRFHHEFHARSKRDELVRPSADRGLLEALIADLLEVPPL